LTFCQCKDSRNLDISSMGIEGLWKHLVCFSERMNIQHFRHQFIAVDASSWLHRSVISMSSAVWTRVMHQNVCEDIEDGFITKIIVFSTEENKAYTKNVQHDV
jgi:XPG N-terminal domain